MASMRSLGSYWQSKRHSYRRFGEWCGPPMHRRISLTHRGDLVGRALRTTSIFRARPRSNPNADNQILGSVSRVVIWYDNRNMIAALRNAVSMTLLRVYVSATHATCAIAYQRVAQVRRLLPHQPVEVIDLDQAGAE